MYFGGIDANLVNIDKVIKGKMKHAVSNFDFEKTDNAIEKLLFGVHGN